MRADTSKDALEASFGASGAIAEAGWTNNTREPMKIALRTMNCFISLDIRECFHVSPSLSDD